MPLSSRPTLRLELFGCIVDNVGHQNPALESMSPEQFETLKSCALSCTSLAPLCQAQIFKRIDLVNFDRDTTHHQRRLLRLTDIFVESPHLAHHVRVLAADLLTFGEPPYQDTLSSSQFERIQTALLSLPKLQSLLLPGSPFTSTQLTDRWRTFNNSLINTYVAQRTLEHIDIGFERGDCPFEEILSSPQFRTLEIGYINIPRVHFPISNITSLNLYGSAQFPLSFLCSLPYLESLEISNIRTFATGSLDTRFPSFKLKELVLMNWDIPQFFEFYLLKSSVAKTPPFPVLEILHVLGKTQADIDAIQSLKGLLPSLREFDIDASECSEVVVPLIALNLSDICHGCTVITLNVSAEPFALSYNRTMEEIISAFIKLSRNNMLQVLRIILDGEIYDHELPSSEYWSRLADVLAIRSNFPNLRSIEVQLFLSAFSLTGNESDIVLEFKKDERKEELKTHITDAMVALSCRPEVQYNGQILVGGFDA